MRRHGGAILVTLAPAALAPNRPHRGRQPVHRGQRQRHGRAHRARPGVAPDRPVVRDREPAGWRRLAGAATVAKADPDGYTILLYSCLAQRTGVVLHKTLPYDPSRDFVTGALFGIQPSVLVAAPSKGWKSVADLVAAAKASPGALNFASAGVGSASHMAGERLRVATDIQVQHIPFRGPVEAFTEVMAGRVEFYFLPIAPAMATSAAARWWRLR